MEQFQYVQRITALKGIAF